MRLNFKFTNLCGVVYKQGNLIFTEDGNGLFSPVGRRVTFFDLANNSCHTFPFELKKEIQHIAITPNGTLLLAVDIEGNAVLCNIPKRVVLHHFNFKSPISAIKFSPDGLFLVTVINGKRIRLWRTPNGIREFAPLALDKTMGGHTDDIISVDWSHDGRLLLTASLDMTSRIYDLKKDEFNPDYTPIELRAHRHPLVGAYLSSDETKIFTIGSNGTCLEWNFDRENLKIVGGAPISNIHLLNLLKKQDDLEQDEKEGSFGREMVTAVSFNRENNMISVGYSSGIFALYKLEPFEVIYSLGISQAKISFLTLNKCAEWLALGIEGHGQLLVWEWRSETFILKQQGHASMMNSLAYSNDGQTIATGSEDGKLKLWNSQNGLCFTTFTEHKGAITAVEFSKSGKIVISASTDGSVRVFDLLRFRNFRTFVSPTPVQFISLAVDPNGDVVAAGTLDTFEIYLWSMQTGQLLEIIGGHTGPVSSLVFDPIGHSLASGSWDRTVRLWEVFQRNKNMQVLEHSSDVLDITFRSDGQEIAVATLKGEIVLWNTELATINASMDVRRDFSEKPLSTSSIKSISYSPDGTTLLCGGSFPFLCLYDVSSRILLRQFPVATLRRDRSGENRDIKVSSVGFCPTGRSFCALTQEGLVIFSVDDNLIFDPFDLEIDLTPENIKIILEEEKHYLKAFIMAIRLNIPHLIEEVWQSIPSISIPFVTRDIPAKYLLPTISFLAVLSNKTNKIQLLLEWISGMLHFHGLTIKSNSRGSFSAPLRIIIKNIKTLYGDLSKVTDQTIYTLEYFQHKKPVQ